MEKRGKLEEGITQINEIFKRLEVSDESLKQVADEINYRIKVYNNISERIEGEVERKAMESALDELNSLNDFIKYRLLHQFPPIDKS